MSKQKHLRNYHLAFVTVLAISSGALAQNNLTAKVNSLQPQPASAVAESDRVRDGLVGPVRRIRTEVAKLSLNNGRPLEEKRVLIEIVAYDVKGTKTENQYFPIAGSTLTGKEVYKYDEKGNISEMTLLNSDGSLLSKEVYKYDYDFVGNWNKMTTSVAVVDGGKINFEPSEVTYRTILYYLDENMMKTMQPPSSTDNSAPASTANKVADPAPIVSSPSPTKPASNSTKSADRRQKATNTSSPSLPAPRAAAERMGSIDSTELMKSNASTNDSKATMINVDSEPPPSPSPKPLLKPVSGGVLNSNALSLPAPYYPDAAKRMRMMGTVVVEVVIDESGKVISAQASSGPQILRDAAVQAALKAKFSPTKLSGQPVKVSGVINYKFSLSQ